ncbi:hypothetical protein [Soonwooa sp.]|uniref:hypothetical protein n=1 Tax=Soonwooa sp. TaxID=1938592 RepID=UPI0028A6BED4|nr:hypothetical protein [Soonwooa sp.]
MDWIMNAKVVFPENERRSGFTIRRISEAVIETSWKTICDTGELILPGNVKDFDSKKVKDVFRRGDKIEIYLGYGMDEDLKLEFTGYIDKVSADYPITLRLEDIMWKWKQIPVKFVSENTSLKNFLQKIAPDIPMDIDATINLGAVRFSKSTLGEVLRKLQEEYSLYSFVRNGKLTIGKPYSDVKKEIPSFDLERNCVSTSLNYLSREERLVRIIGQSIQTLAKAVKNKEKDKKLKFEFGDDNANDTINCTFNVQNIKELECEVKRMYDLKKKEGWDGSFLTFGYPSLQHGEKIKLTSSLYPDREGIYYVDSIKKTFNKDGFRQEPELGPAYNK